MKKRRNEKRYSRSTKSFNYLQRLAMVVFLTIGVSGFSSAKGTDRDQTEVAQQQHKVTGVVVDSNGEPLPGVAIYVKETTIGTITDFDGKYIIKTDEDAILVFSFIGMTSQEISVSGRTEITVTLEDETELIEDVVVVGYGIQKKESVVGAITRATGEELQQAGGVTNVGEALQGRLPGVTAISSSGLPGQTDPKIYIRGQSSWNGSGGPLILVDGVERSMGDIDMNEIEQISVLKDASATAVFGVQGGNGVILITTKRGKEGKAKLNVSANYTMKVVSKIPEKLDSFDAIMVANEAITREMMHEPGSWDKYIPSEIADKYRNPASIEESYIYPNVDWQDVLLKDFASDYRVNMSVRGGTEFAKYFGSLSFQSQEDIFKGGEHNNNKGYSSEFSYNRFNYRSNLDFSISKTTKFSVNLSGYLSVQEKPTDDLRTVVNAIYALAPNMYTPVYPDGYYGIEPSGEFTFVNPLVSLTNQGYKTNKKFQVNSDFELEQKLDFITKGLKAKAKLSYDNNLSSSQRLWDNGADGYRNVYNRYYDINGNEYVVSPEGVNDFDFVVQPWSMENMSVNDGSRMSRLAYELHLNYKRAFGEHNTSALFLVKREEEERTVFGIRVPRYRENWVGRFTYDYNSRYFIEGNGAYNGSEQFGPGYRFDFFPSVALGWMVSNESFMGQYDDWLDKLKVRGSYGLVGDDRIGDKYRWQFMTQWNSGGYADLVSSEFGASSPYIWYGEDVIGNPDLHWEEVVKSNIGFELALLRNSITVDFDYFKEDRSDVVIAADARRVSDYAPKSSMNIGKTKVQGYELVLGFNHTFSNGINVWSNYSMTDAKDEVLYKEDPELTPFYQKAEGYAIGQTRAGIPGEILTNWDDIYMSTPTVLGQTYVRPGYYDVVDFDGNGAYDRGADNAPFGYTTRPQRTWNLTTGAGYKGLKLMAQFYGTQNATRSFSTSTFTKQSHIYFEHAMGYWSKDNPNSSTTLGPWTLNQAVNDPYKNLYDASIVRLKTVELSYDFPKKVCEKMGIGSLKVFANGNNLYLWTDLPDDREFNGSNTQESGYRGDYPTMKRFNFGLNVNF